MRGQKDRSEKTFERPRLLSAHIGYLFTEVRFEERFRLARSAGFDAVEHPDPQLVPASQMRELLDDNGLTFAQMSSGAGGPGEKGLAALPGRQSEFRAGFERALDYAEAIACPLLHPMAGVPDGVETAAARQAYRGNVEFAVEACRGRPVKVLIEAISHAAVPGYFVPTLAEAKLLTGEVITSDEVYFLLDTFHAAASGVDPVEFLSENADRVGHVHIADFPGRHEPGSGAIDFRRLLLALHRCNYDGFIGFEYLPVSTTLSSLGWLQDWRSLAAG
jgi:hydroxypyruvate isomerase